MPRPTQRASRGRAGVGLRRGQLRESGHDRSDRRNGGDDVSSGEVLAEKAGGAGFLRCHGVEGRTRGRHYQHARLRRGCSDSPNCFDRIDAWQLGVYENKVGMKLRGFRDELGAVLGTSDYLDSLRGTEESPQAMDEKLVRVAEQNSDRRRAGGTRHLNDYNLPEAPLTLPIWLKK